MFLRKVEALRLRATGGSSWVSVTGSNGSQLFQGVLADGDAGAYLGVGREA